MLHALIYAYKFRTQVHIEINKDFFSRLYCNERGYYNYISLYSK